MTTHDLGLDGARDKATGLHKLIDEVRGTHLADSMDGVPIVSMRLEVCILRTAWMEYR